MCVSARGARSNAIRTCCKLEHSQAALYRTQTTSGYKHFMMMQMIGVDAAAIARTTRFGWAEMQFAGRSQAKF